MKIVLIIGLLIVIATLGVLLHEQSTLLNLDRFPVQETEHHGYKTPFILYLYIFITPEDQPENLEIIEEFNRLPSHFKVFGVMPDLQPPEEKKLRQITGAKFPFKTISPFRRFTPFYTPTIVGASEKGKIYFVYPLTAGEDLVFKRFLFVFYQNINEKLLKEKN
jgi:hypothetical protein